MFRDAINKNIRDVDNFWDGLGYFFQGGIVGAVTGPAIGMNLNPFTEASVLNGLYHGVFNGNWNKLGNAGKISLGNFYLDENRTFFGGVWRGVSRFTRGKKNMMVGSAYTHFQNATGKVDRVDFFGGATFATNENNSSISGNGSGVSLGNFVNINISGEIEGVFDTYLLNNGLYMHEYGHYLDSQTLGLNYLYIIGVPSLFSALEDDGDHNYYWTEKRANGFAAQYFGYYFGVNWSSFENKYPR